ncbi:murein L,D-transpeptidase catalytic domain family protein [uncultured Sphingomonas sp.]|uniref:murein L,D-transpeptidase catalytic domain family protein n=1 Tax=uncultured Sphingomonas sp. TaxID=158754 RepID=UPI00263653B8|nr:murein L,D-transpeptidase catalytic domain family protein [uncultured Sphingomonas sp.]
MIVPALSRRDLLRSASAGVAASICAVPAASAQHGLAAAATGVDPWLIDRALLALAEHNAAVWSRDVVAIADFGLPSATPRFHLVDILSGTTTSLRVAHGRGSDPDHSGMLQSFSNIEGSAATSEGAYLTGDTYAGVHGLSRRLVGLDPSDDRAEARAVVIHAAWYADPDMVAKQGKLGRSDGCFAFGEQDIALVLARLAPGRLIYAGRAREAQNSLEKIR